MKYLFSFLFVFTISIQLTYAQNSEEIYLSKTLDVSFETASDMLKKVLKEQGFGVITEIDMDQTLKEKLPDIEMQPYKILGVCNPPYAYETLQIEENIGLFLPCKAIVKYLGKMRSEVVLVNPAALMGMLGNEELLKVANEVTEKFKIALDNL